MAELEHVKRLPSSKEVGESLRDPAALVALGDSAVEHAMSNKYKYDPQWFDSLLVALGTLKDAIEFKTRINTAVAELALLLLRPVEVARPLSRAEIADIEEPSEEEIEAWTWGADLAETTKWFAFFVVLWRLGSPSFAVLTFGLESPGSITTIVFLTLGSLILACATLVLGIGLYRHYVVGAHLSWEYKGYPDAEVKRSKHFYQVGGWYAYTIGGVFLALSVAFAIIAGKRLLPNVVPDYTIVRLALLASIALGLCLFGLGVWPIVRKVVGRAEADRRMGKAKYMASPRLLLALLPILTSTLSLVISWLFR